MHVRDVSVIFLVSGLFVGTCGKHIPSFAVSVKNIAVLREADSAKYRCGLKANKIIEVLSAEYKP